MASPDNTGEFERQLGAHLAALRERAGLSQEALAVQLQRDQSYVSRIERADRHPSLPYLIEVSEALNVPFEELAASAERIWRSLRAR